MPELHSSLLQSTLHAELRAAWKAVHAAHAGEGLYGFGVVTTDSASTLSVTAFSEAGLEAAVAAALVSKRGKGRDPALVRQNLRWSLVDSPLHEEGADLLPEANLLVQELDAEADEDDDFDADDFEEGAEFDDVDDEGETLDTLVDEVFEIAVEALQDLDEEGLFGSGPERERLVLCVWKADQSNLERYDFARMLNPPAVARRFGEEMNAGNQAFYKLYLPDEALPEDDVFE
ncbi:DUF4303 domain-containing protein [Scleromatobacter humisilvae]|uniref:DUF4303 domain-containing protein n=1 Tax=Scleromatobacter humisilvae TaxID=2897159 RepID=A0A9X1YE44_9BURK|nr:DUF4303 domain-containing protein [Scleromatobacter humisilvae]MCK9684524.1 DUF4303 domain-containing protein [Scleromatobacter humisilvae]